MMWVNLGLWVALDFYLVYMIVRGRKRVELYKRNNDFEVNPYKNINL